MTEMGRYFCSICKKTIDEAVYTYSYQEHHKALCRDCQDKQAVSGKKKSKNSAAHKRNNTPKNTDTDYNMIKGRVAEALIEQLFLKLDYNVFRYGMENTIPGAMKLLSQIRSEVANTIRRMPDFVIQNKKTGEAFFVEVKFSKDEIFNINNLKEHYYGPYPFENAFFIIVSKQHIKCVSYTQLKEGKKITSDSHNYLGKVKEFETDKETIVQFCKYAVNFFKGVD